MSQRPVLRVRGHLPRGALLSLLLHFHLLVPIGLAAWIYGGRQQAVREAEKAQEVDVEFKDVTAEELPPDLPSIRSAPGSARGAEAAAAPGGAQEAGAEESRRRRATD